MQRIPQREGQADSPSTDPRKPQDAGILQSRRELIEWHNEVCDNGEDEDIEVMLLARIIGCPPTPCILYNDLNDMTGLDWNSLIGFPS